MTQSDSPDFEFDISDLEVERSDASPSKGGEAVPASDRPTREPEEGEVVDNEGEKSTSNSSEATNPVPGGEDPEYDGVSKIEDTSKRSSRDLGAEDLGADVFAEIESDSGTSSFSDVIDDLMDEVEDFEAGGVVDLEDEDVQISNGDDGVFKMNDPDDSLAQSVDPEAEDDEFEEPEVAPAFPSPPVDFEIPEPEPVEEQEPTPEREVEADFDFPEKEAVAPAATEGERIPKPAAQSGSRQEAPSSVPQTEAKPRTQEPRVVEPQQAAPPSKQENPVPSVKSELPSEIPSPSVESEVEFETSPASDKAGSPRAVTEEEPEPIEEPQEPSMSEEPEVEPIAEGEPEVENLLDKEPPAPVEGREQVFFDSTVDEPLLDNPVLDSDLEDSSEEEIESPDQDLSADGDEEPQDNTDEITTESGSIDQPEPVGERVFDTGLEEVAEEIPDDEEVAPVGVEEEESVSEEETEPKRVAEDPSDTPADATSSNSEDEENLEVGTTAIPEDDDEDLSDLVASVVEEIEEGEESVTIESEDDERIEQDDPEEEIADLPQPEDVLDEIESEETENEANLEEVSAESDEEDISDLIASVQDEEFDESTEDIASGSAESAGDDEEEVVELPSAADIAGGEDAEEIETEGSDVLDDLEDIEEEPAETAPPSPPELIEVPEEEAESSDEPQGEDLESEEAAIAEKPPSAEDLLKKAGSLLNGTSEKPVDEASSMLDDIEVDDDDEIVELPSPESLVQDGEIEEDDAAAEDDELVSMPDPASLMVESEEEDSDDDDDEIVSLPDPASLMEESDETPAVLEDDDEVVSLPDPASMLSEVEEDDEETADDPADAPAEEESSSGNVADRAGDLPPPPPAPVEILDDEPAEEDVFIEDEVVDDGIIADGPTTESEGGEDSAESEISTDDFDDELDGLEDLAAEGVDEGPELEGEEASGDAAESQKKSSEKPVVVEMPKPSLVWRVTHSMMVAAGLVLVGLAGVLFLMKQQIVEYIEGQDIDGSALVLEVEKIGKHALSEFDKEGLYRMQWVDSDVRQVSENEIRLHALVGARLRENLYQPVLESEMAKRSGYEDGKLMQALSVAHELFPEEISRYPDKPWDSLYELTSSKDEVLSLRFTYGLTRESKEDDWELSRVKVSGANGKLEWPEGKPAFEFGENAYDIDSTDFKSVLADYREKSGNYVARIDRLKTESQSEEMALKRENDRQRERVRMALSEGAYFSGVAIMGIDATKSRDIQLLITEVRNEGALVKGVVKMDEESGQHSKHFLGKLDFETSLSGKEQGYLNLRTVSIDAPKTFSGEDEFFEPSNVTRMKLRADGFRLEGDSRDLSLRLTRHM